MQFNNMVGGRYSGGVVAAALRWINSSIIHSVVSNITFNIILWNEFQAVIVSMQQQYHTVSHPTVQYRCVSYPYVFIVLVCICFCFCYSIIIIIIVAINIIIIQINEFNFSIESTDSFCEVNEMNRNSRQPQERCITYCFNSLLSFLPLYQYCHGQ